MSRRFDVVTFLSDFGRSDIFVGVCHAAIAVRAPGVRIIDLTHDVPPQDVRAGALLLARAVPHLPVGVHLAVVDPGVGTARVAVAARTGRGDVLVGPDNGLLGPAAALLGGVTAVHELAPPPDADRVSATFHGRDLFAPAAGAIAAGGWTTAVGAAREGLATVEVASPDVAAGRLTAEIVLVDHFGNLQLAAGGEMLGDAGLAPGDVVELASDDDVHRLAVGTYVR